MGGSRREAALAALTFVALALLPLAAPAYYLQFGAKVLLVGLAAMALNLVVGFGGLVSLCHAAFYGLAGYTLALVSPRYEAASLFWTLPLAVGASAVAALLIGALSLRTRGVYFIMVTLAFGQMLFYLFADTDIAGGSDGFYIYTRPELALGGLTLVDLDKPTGFYLTALATVALATLLLLRLTRSPFGQALAAAHENERRARALGFPVYRIRLAAFTVSGALAGLAGYFASVQFGYVAPQMLGWHFSATILVMVVLGGLGSVTGPLVGASAFLGLEEVLKAALPDHWALALGTVILLVVLLLPGGVRQLADAALGPLSRERPPGKPLAAAEGATGA